MNLQKDIQTSQNTSESFLFQARIQGCIIPVKENKKNLLYRIMLSHLPRIKCIQPKRTEWSPEQLY